MKNIVNLCKSIADNGTTTQRKDWEKPVILSVEPLEAAASTCQSGGMAGKIQLPNGTCGVLGS